MSLKHEYSCLPGIRATVIDNGKAAASRDKPEDLPKCALLNEPGVYGLRHKKEKFNWFRINGSPDHAI